MNFSPVVSFLSNSLGYANLFGTLSIYLPANAMFSVDSPGVIWYCLYVYCISSVLCSLSSFISLYQSIVLIILQFFPTIGNLDEKVTERILYEILIQPGRVVDLCIPRDKETSCLKGYAFAEYETEEIAQYAVQLFSGLVRLYGKTLKFAVGFLFICFFLFGCVTSI